MQRTALFWVFLVLVSTGNDAAADENASPSIESNRVDLAAQGEYRGWQQTNRSSRSLQPIGLQVIARGDGKFEATKYVGGLPGERRYRPKRYLLEGRRAGEFVELIGENFDILLEGGAAVVLDKEARVAGELTRVERISPTLGLQAPPDAIVLFSNGEASRLMNPRISEDGYLLAGTQTTEPYQHFRMHAEFRLPFRPEANGQERGNSGFYLQSRYEVQVLDSFGLAGLNNECGALYKQRAPDLNMCFPPMQWQTYDIDFRAPVIGADGQKRENARISVWHNGTLIHDDVEIISKTGAGQPEGRNPLPTKIQDHGNPVEFRNLWLVETEDGVESDWPPLPPHVPPRPANGAGRLASLNR